MLRYKFLLFDLDDTIFDFQTSEQLALSQLFQDLKIPLTPTLRQRYHHFNQQLWQMYERSEITRDELLLARFPLFFKKMGLPLHGQNPGQIYRKALAAGHQLLPGALGMLTDLSKSYRIFAVTNGIAQTQRERLRAAEIAGYFDDVFISEEIGHQKPKKAFFDYVFNHIPKFDAKKTVVIGDSLTSDILGGVNARVDTVWFNPNFLPNRTKISPVYQISAPDQLKKLLLASEWLRHCAILEKTFNLLEKNYAAKYDRAILV